jgi:STIP1 family protein 1
MIRNNRPLVLLQTMSPKVSTYFTNRAMCHRKLGDWDRVEEDCRTSLSIDKYNTKGGYLLGLAYGEKKHWKEAIRYLGEAVEMATRQSKPKSFREEVVTALRRAKKEDWVQDSEAEVARLQVLGFTSQDQPQIKELVDAAISRLQPQPIPDHFQCKISFEVFRDPVSVPSGASYERTMIEEHLRKNSTDPITRAPLFASQLVPNMALRDACESYLDANPWAFESDA